MNNNFVLQIATFAVPIAFCLVPVGAGAQECSQQKMKLQIQKYHLEFKLKEKKCVEIGKSYELKVQQAGPDDVQLAIGDITVYEKGQNGLTIRGTNDVANPTTMMVDIGGNANLGDEFEFYVNVKGVGTLDPIVRVVDGLQSLEFGVEEVGILLDEEFDIGLEALQIFHRTQ